MAVTMKSDFIILDIQLPDIDGLEVIRKIRNLESCRSIPIVAVTSYAVSGDRQKLLSADFNSYIEKPIDPGHFIS